MVTVRLSGNRLLTRFRPDRLLPALAVVAMAGLAAALLIAEPPAALLGFGCLGIGLASVVPAVFSAAGRYWQHRPAYDLGQPPAEYWSEVLARDLSRSPQLVDRLTDVDVHGWLRPNPLTLPTLLRRVRRTGIQLALLSNAPEPIAQAIDHSRWSQHFDHCYYSCRLDAAKPDPRAFQIVLRGLGAKPDEVLFIDDRAENTAAARNLGMRTITFTSASALDRELCLVARA
jgi:putative hydrolase of the HAD superfamily